MKTKTLNALENVVDANNRFAFSLFAEYESEEGNVLFSPYSISSALAMTYEGAKGETAKEMKKVLHLPAKNKLRQGFENLNTDINKEGKEYELSTANALWAQNGYEFLKKYFDTVEKHYGGKVTNLNFVAEAEGSRQTINTWVEEKTNDKIKDLIPQGAINSLTRLVLTNAVYFFGKWAKPFDKELTYECDFKTSPSSKVKSQMMRLNQLESFNYAETDNTQILELPYAGEEVSMLILLPKEGEIGNLEKMLSQEKLTEWRNSLRRDKVEVYLPKFKFSAKYFMSNTLKKMGMHTAFSDSADLSGMTGKKDLSISDVIHQSFIEVNEESTEAAGATAVIALRTSVGTPDYKTFIADHPFLFTIQQRNTGNILFLGRVSDPS